MLLAIVAGVFAAMVLGMIWYHPAVFGRIWCSQAFPGKSMEDAAKENMGMAGPMVMSMLANAVVMLIMYYVLGKLIGVSEVYETIQVAALLGVLVATISIPHYAFAGRPWVMFAIDEGYNVAVLILGVAAMMCVEIGFWT